MIEAYPVGMMIEKFGIGIGVLILCILFLSLLVRWILRDTSDREKRLTNIIENHLSHIATSLNQASTTMEAVQKASDEAHGHQQQEHQKMIVCLTEIAAKQQIPGESLT